jgi:acyl-CoA thioester hydrolase
MQPLLAEYCTRVRPEWIDYNGHMNLAYYVLVFDQATDRLLDHLGLGEAYRRATNHSIYVLEAHITYDQELRVDDPLAISTRLVDSDTKRLHIFHSMRHAEAGYRAATTELLALHVDLGGPRAAALPADAAASIARLLDSHRRLPLPEPIGRSISLTRRKSQSN